MAIARTLSRCRRFRHRHRSRPEWSRRSLLALASHGRPPSSVVGVVVVVVVVVVVIVVVVDVVVVVVVVVGLIGQLGVVGLLGVVIGLLVGLGLADVHGSHLSQGVVDFVGKQQLGPNTPTINNERGARGHGVPSRSITKKNRQQFWRGLEQTHQAGGSGRSI